MNIYQLYTCKSRLIFGQGASKRYGHRLEHSHWTKCVFSSSTRELSSIVPVSDFTAVGIKDVPQIVALDGGLVAANFGTQAIIFLFQFCGADFATDGLVFRQFGSAAPKSVVSAK